MNQQPAGVVARLLVVASPDSPELTVLEQLPAGVEVLAIGKTQQDFAHLTPEQWAGVNVCLNFGVGKFDPSRVQIQDLWPRLPGLTWLHSTAAGLEHFLFPALRDSPQVTLTNARGVFSHSLAEFTLTACSWFAKDLPRMRAQQRDKRWEPYDVEELRGKTMGIIGYGDIGQACARLARAFKMRVVALRRRTLLTEAEVEEGVVAQVYGPDQLHELMAVSDYVVMATPHTPATDKMVGASALAAMKPTGVFVNVGRGKCVDEQALIQALQQGRIRGAALDVFEVEPPPEDSPLWQLDNVLMSPHCANRTKGNPVGVLHGAMMQEFQYENLIFFRENLERFVAGQGLQNVVDKQAGY